MSPAVDGTRVVWADHRSGNWDLYTADLSQPNPVGVPLVVAPGDQTNPQLSGDRVVWQDNRNGDWDIYSGSLSSGAVATVCTAAGDQAGAAYRRRPHRLGGPAERELGHLHVHGLLDGPRARPDAGPARDHVAGDVRGRVRRVRRERDAHRDPVVGRRPRRREPHRRRVGQSGELRDPDRRAGLSNVVVRNLRLTNWETGIRAENATSSAIEGCDVEHNGLGVVLEGTRDVAVRENRIVANDDLGVGVYRSANATVHANDISRTGDGFEHIDSATMDLDTFAIVVSSSDGTEISSNDLGGEFGSLDLAGATATRVTGNQLTGRRIGIFSLSRSEARSWSTTSSETPTTCTAR